MFLNSTYIIGGLQYDKVSGCAPEIVFFSSKVVSMGTCQQSAPMEASVI